VKAYFLKIKKNFGKEVLTLSYTYSTPNEMNQSFLSTKRTYSMKKKLTNNYLDFLIFINGLLFKAIGKKFVHKITTQN